MTKFIITEDERKHIMGLYEQTVPVTPEINSGSTPTTTEKPDYRYIKTTKREWFKDKEITPTEEDRADYRIGFENRIKGIRLSKRNPIPPNEIRGAREAKDRGLGKK
jgi:hypothetical protein